MAYIMSNSELHLVVLKLQFGATITDDYFALNCTLWY